MSLDPAARRLKSMFSGLGVFYPDKRPTQRIGIIPDIEVRRTRTGIRDGRDELIEAAIEFIRTVSLGVRPGLDIAGRSWGSPKLGHIVSSCTLPSEIAELYGSYFGIIRSDAEANLERR